MAAYDYGENFGQVKRLYPTRGTYPSEAKTYFSLTGGTTAMKPKNDYYCIHGTHTNYGALIDLLYLAAEHKWKLNVRTDPTLDVTDGSAIVLYLVVDF